MTAATDRIVATSANGTSRRGSIVSPPGTGTTSYPPYMKISSSAPPSACRTVSGGSVVRRAGSTYHTPTMMKMASGISLAMVSALMTHAP